MNKETKMVKGQWYIYRRGKDDLVCDKCRRKTNLPFICNGLEVPPPFHPNCLCSVESYRDKLISRIRANWPTISNAKLDELLQKEYYKYYDVAIPIGGDGEYYYYKVVGIVYKVNLSTLNGIGKLPNGQFIIGHGDNERNMYLYEQIKALEAVRRIENDPSLTLTQRNRWLNEEYDETRIRIENYYKKHSKPFEEDVVNDRIVKWLATPLETYEIVDITDELNERMLSYSDNPEYMSIVGKVYPIKLYEFSTIVASNCPEDLKSNKSKDNTVFNNRCLYVYDGEIVDADALANISYGFLGKQLDIKEKDLLLWAGVAQIADNVLRETTTVGDDPRDKYRVQQGIALFGNNTYKLWKNAG